MTMAVHAEVDRHILHVYETLASIMTTFHRLV